MQISDKKGVSIQAPGILGSGAYHITTSFVDSMNVTPRARHPHADVRYLCVARLRGHAVD